jgi:hypothetical protein
VVARRSFTEVRDGPFAQHAGLAAAAELGIGVRRSDRRDGEDTNSVIDRTRSDRIVFASCGLPDGCALS